MTGLKLRLVASLVRTGPQGSLELAAVKEGFIDDDLALRGAPDVAAVVGVGIIGSAEELLDDVGLVVAIGIAKPEKLAGLGDDDAILVEGESVGELEAFRKDGALVGLAVAVGVFEDEDGVVGEVAGKGEGVACKTVDPQAAAGVELDLEGIDEFGEFFAGSEKVDLEAVGNLEAWRGLALGSE